MSATYAAHITIERAGAVSDDELERLLTAVYVDGGFTEPAMAPTLFAAAAVRARGLLVTVRAQTSGALLGIVMVVPPGWEAVGSANAIPPDNRPGFAEAGIPGAPARRLAQDDEAEMHLLAVAAEARGRGIGRVLVDEAVRVARDAGSARMLLWTQPTMHTAQHLYLAAGFTRTPARDFQRGDRAFLVFTCAL